MMTRHAAVNGRAGYEFLVIVAVVLRIVEHSATGLVYVGKFTEILNAKVFKISVI